ncbi:MAG: flagellar biosynthesis anti-sigma factor FlgM [Gammaproteobacteria bacterium]|nr:flagellar biosynthesis anti-sigma factor FlgM [Gammaproteobacteria bacterium]
MTVDKPFINGTHPARDAVGLRRANHGNQPVLGDRVAAQTTAVAAAVDPVQVSTVSREMSAALGPNSMDEMFDHDKVEAIRREIREGRFPIDEERLAKKFRELEKELGDLGA